MNLNRIICILYLLLFFTGEVELYAWTYPTSKPPYPFSSGDGSSSNPYEIRNEHETAYVLIDSIIKKFVMMKKISKIKFMLY